MLDWFFEPFITMFNHLPLWLQLLIVTVGMIQLFWWLLGTLFRTLFNTLFILVPVLARKWGVRRGGE